MRLGTVFAVIGAAFAIAAIVWAVSGFLLGFFYAIPVVFISTIAAKRSEPNGRVHSSLCCG